MVTEEKSFDDSEKAVGCMREERRCERLTEHKFQLSLDWFLYSHILEEKFDEKLRFHILSNGLQLGKLEGE